MSVTALTGINLGLLTPITIDTLALGGTTGDQTYFNDVTLFQNATLTSTTGGDINFVGTIDGSSAGAQTLTVDAAVNAIFDDSIGDTTSLGALEVTANTGTIQLNGAVVNTELNAIAGTSGTQTYNSNTVLGTTVSMTATGVTGDAITFNALLDGSTDETESINLVAGSNGNIVFNGAVGSGTRLNEIFIPVTAGGANDVTFNSTVSAFGFTQLAGSGTTTFDALFDFTNNFEFVANELTINGSGTNSVGTTMEVTNAGLFTTDIGANLLVGNSFTQDGAGSNSLGGSITSTNDSISFLRDVTLTAGITMTSGGGLGDVILFSSTVDGTTDDAESLDLSAGLGSITFQGAVGSDTRLGEIVVINALDATFNSTVSAFAFTQLSGTGTTTFAQLFDFTNNFEFIGNNLTINGLSDNTAGTSFEVDNAGLFTTAVGANVVAGGRFDQFGTGANSIGGDIASVTSFINFDTQVDLTNNVVMQSGLGLTDDITYGSTVDGLFDLVVIAGGGDVFFDAAVGSIAPLASLSVISADFTTHFAGNVTTVGDQTYNGGAQLDADIVFTATDTDGDITFNGEVRSGTGVEDMTVLAGGNVAFENNVGGADSTTQIGTFTVDCGDNFGETIAFGAAASTVRAVNVNLNTNTLLTTPATVATIVALDNISFANTTFAMGQNHKLTGLGNITIGGLAVANATSVTLGDVNAVGNLRVTSPSITLLARAAGSIRTNTGGSINDPMVDYVVGGQVFFSTAPVMGGSGGRATFSNPTGNVDGSGTLGNFAKTVYRTPITVALLTGQVGSGITGQILDLSAASGVSYTNPSTIIPQAMPSLPPVGLLGDSDTLDKEDADDATDGKSTGGKSADSKAKKTASEKPKSPAVVPVASR